MALGGAFIIVAVLIFAIWVFIEFKRFRHKLWAVLLILMILFTYFSFTAVIKERDINLKTFEGMKEAGTLYLAWLGHAFGNIKMITTNAVNMDWKANESEDTKK